MLSVQLSLGIATLSKKKIRNLLRSHVRFPLEGSCISQTDNLQFVRMGKSEMSITVIYPSISTLSNVNLSVVDSGTEANVTSSVSVSIERDVSDSTYTFAPFYILKIESLFEEDDSFVFEIEPNDDMSLKPCISSSERCKRWPTVMRLPRCSGWKRLRDP